MCLCVQKIDAEREDCVNVSRATVLLNGTNCDILITSFPPAVILTDRFTACKYYRTKAKCQMLHTEYIVYCIPYTVYFKKRRALFASTLDLELRKKLVKCYIWSIALYGAETWTLRAVDQKHLESFEMWCWRRMEKISWTDHVRNEDVLLRVKEQRNILREIRKRNANWIGHILRRNCLLRRVIEGKIKGGTEVTGRQGRRRRKLLDDFQERRGYSHLKEEALDRTMWRARFGRGFGPVVRQTAK